MINIYLKKYNPLQENAVVEFFKKTASFANSQIYSKFKYLCQMIHNFAKKNISIA